MEMNGMPQVCRTNSDIPELSVVVIGRNEGKRLARCLESVGTMHWAGSFEVIYADSDSTDGSPQLAQSMGARVIAARPARPTAAFGRNAGWRQARAPFVLFLDGDTVLHRDFVTHALGALAADPSIAVVWGHRREIATQASVFNRVLDLDWIYPAGFTEFCGGDALIRRSVLGEVGGYDELLIAGEEPEMCRRIRGRGYRIYHLDRPMTGHDLAMTRCLQYWRRAVRAGYAYAEVSARFRNTGDPFWEEDVRRNRARGALAAIGATAALLGPLATGSFLPTVLIVLAGVGLVLRSAAKSRWRSRDWGTLLLYGIHSHLQQIPILAGQCKFLADRRKGRVRQLIEYKEAVR
jgi:hypothetical protein